MIAIATEPMSKCPLRNNGNDMHILSTHISSFSPQIKNATEDNAAWIKIRKMAKMIG